ncbi:hypothetical protein IMZ48_20805 [Candidatus Bathyarchaeota archaeon]|nr:hypothetical protein [Candidatus Bathyarchaeota archaeon]
MQRNDWSSSMVHRNYDNNTRSARVTRWDRAYDKRSIMHYPIQRGDTQSVRTIIPENIVLSDGDRESLASLYPPLVVSRRPSTVSRKPEETREQEKRVRAPEMVGRPSWNVVRVSGNNSAVVYGGGHVEVSGNAGATVYGDSSVKVSGNASVTVFGSGTAVVSGNGMARFTGNGTGKVSGNGVVLFNVIG